MSGSFWTPDRVATLRALVAEAVPYREIAEGWGVSRNVPIGKAHRLGIVHPNRPKKREPEPTTTLSRLDAIDPFPESGRCLFPTSDNPPYQFCGRHVPVVGSPYCAKHLARTYRPASPPAIDTAAGKAAAI